MKLLTILIPIKDKEKERIDKCLSYLKKAIQIEKDCVDIFLLDYGSKEPIYRNDVEVISYKADEWNKYHCLNLGIKDIETEYVMTLDVDMIMTKEIFSEVISNLQDKNFIVDTNVRKIDIKEIDIDKSLPWNENKNQYLTSTVGGMQVFSKNFWKEVGGYCESFGKEWGCGDIYFFTMARMNGLTTIDISSPFLHMSHIGTEKNLTDEEKNLLNEWIHYKSRYIDFMCKSGIKRNCDSYICKKEPCLDIYNIFLVQLKDRPKVLRNAFLKGEKQVKYMLETYQLIK